MEERIEAVAAAARAKGLTFSYQGGGAAFVFEVRELATGRVLTSGDRTSKVDTIDAIGAFVDGFEVPT